VPRLMSVALTVPQVRDRSKTVTRRDGWLMLKSGDIVTLCEKTRGRKPGDPLVRITDVTIVSVRREPLSAITEADVTAEGFPGWSTGQFIGFFTQSHPGCGPQAQVTRIQWAYLGGPASPHDSGGGAG
jgi:hypothetical protein